MNAVVLVVTLFFYGAEKPPQAAAFMVSSLEFCSKLGNDAIVQIPKMDQTVRDVEPVCMTMTLKDMT